MPDIRGMGPATGYARPTPTGKVSNPFGATQVRTPGMTGPLPPYNRGTDFPAALGDPATALTSGVVVSVYHAKADRDPAENGGWGGSVLIKGDDGNTYRHSHLQKGSITVRPGQRVETGQQLAGVGQTGNATAPIVDVEAYDPQGRDFDVTTLLRGGAGPPGGTAGTSIESLIRRVAQEEGIDPNLAVAIARHESGLDPRIGGDWSQAKGRYRSIGLFQLNEEGMGAGMGERRYDPETNARVALRSLAQTLRQRPELASNPGALAAASQRPADPQGYARSVNALLTSTRNAGGIQLMADTRYTQGEGPAGNAGTATAPPPPPGTGSTLAQLRAEAQRIRDEITATQKQAAAVDSDGDQTPAARRAADRLTKLNDDYRAALSAINTAEGREGTTPANKAGEIRGFTTEINGELRENVPHQWVPIEGHPLGGEWQPMAGQSGSAPKVERPQTFQGTDGLQYLLSDDGRTATAVSGQPGPPVTYSTFTDPSDGSLWTWNPRTGQRGTQLSGAKTEDPSVVAQREAQTRASQLSAARTEALLPFELEEARLQAEAAKQANALAERIRGAIQAAMAIPDIDQRNARLLEISREAAAFKDPTKLQDWANAEASRELQRQQQAETARANQVREQQSQAAAAEQRRQADAQAAQKLADVTSQRQTAFNQAMAQFEQTGILTKGRVAGLNALRAPLPEEQVAAMLGEAPTSPRFQAIYRTYRQALGAPLPAAPAVPAGPMGAAGSAPTPALPPPAPTAPPPATMVRPTPLGPMVGTPAYAAAQRAGTPLPALAPPLVPAAYQQLASVAPPALAPVTLGPDGIPVGSLRLSRLPAAYAA